MVLLIRNIFNRDNSIFSCGFNLETAKVKES